MSNQIISFEDWFGEQRKPVQDLINGCSRIKTALKGRSNRINSVEDPIFYFITGEEAKQAAGAFKNIYGADWAAKYENIIGKYCRKPEKNNQNSTEPPKKKQKTLPTGPNSNIIDKNNNNNDGEEVAEDMDLFTDIFEEKVDKNNENMVKNVVVPVKLTPKEIEAELEETWAAVTDPEFESSAVIALVSFLTIIFSWERVRIIIFGCLLFPAFAAKLQINIENLVSTGRVIIILYNINALLKRGLTTPLIKEPEFMAIKVGSDKAMVDFIGYLRATFGAATKEHVNIGGKNITKAAGFEEFIEKGQEAILKQHKLGSIYNKMQQYLAPVMDKQGFLKKGTINQAKLTKKQLQKYLLDPDNWGVLQQAI